jgi:hypothetical protein
MAPPTGIKTITINLWSSDGTWYASSDDPVLWRLKPVEGQSECEAFERAREAARRELRAWLEQHEPYYVEALLNDYTEFRRHRS